ncbi:MAG: mechanosensitive ion channel [Bacteroidales bacterium]|nr:mechanosensitive ion channel [Bacteroidales bacterium]
MKKRITAAVLALLLIIPAFAVLSEKDLAQTLSVLRYELGASFRNSERMSQRMRGNGERQHARLVRMMQQSNELSLMLYSQKQDYTFDMTYALNEVSRQYDEFSSRRMPFDDIIKRLDIDIDRYTRLIHTLKSLPPSSTVEYLDSLGNVVTLDASVHVSRHSGLERRYHGKGNAFQLDSLGQADRDSCIFYAEKLLEMSTASKQKLVTDSTHYQQTANMLKSAYDYAQGRYKTVQNKIFIDGQTGYLTLLKSFNRYWRLASNDAKDKYSLRNKEAVHSQWRGPMVVGFSLFVLFYLVISVLVSFVLVTFLGKRTSFFKKARLAKNKFTTILIFSVIIFALSIMLASAFSQQHFFSMASKILVEFAWMLAAIFVSLIIRVDEDSVKKGIALYFPTLLMCLIIISFRIAFIPNSLINIIFPPILLIFTLFQGWTLKRYRKALPQSDMVFGWVSMLVMVITTVIALWGYVLLGVQLLIWWFFQLTLLQTVTAVYDILSMYYESHIKETKSRYIEDYPEMPHRTDEDMILVTWPHALIKRALLPMAIVLSIPFSIYLASAVFDLTGIFGEYFRFPFLNVEGYISLSFYKIIMVISLFFVFSFLNYFCKAFYRQAKIRSILKKSSVKVLNENQVNFTLAANVISISLWGIYIISLFALLKIPTAALKVIGAGLATGLGFAMKDILNNFFYGVQLMSGRLRVGDFVECDGIRGKVDSITYQTTQIVAGDGSVMAFPNSTLFNKNFKNLTRNHSYEMLKFPVGVKYGVDVEKVRSIIIEALLPLQKKDKYGRDILDSKFGVQVRFEEFGDNSVNLSVVQFVSVEERFTYASRAKEAVYNALNANGIEIPFPQRDLYIKTLPEKGEGK